ncbi:hypothetical protein C0J52_13347 [Blattella germanica]|nr:hypothetical protein C0J52_13347 [Blattella germanica]
MATLPVTVLAALAFYCVTASVIPNAVELLDSLDANSLVTEHPDTAFRFLQTFQDIQNGKIVPDFTGLNETWLPGKYLSAFLLQQYIKGTVSSENLSIYDILTITEYIKDDTFQMNTPATKNLQLVLDLIASKKAEKPIPISL